LIHFYKRDIMGDKHTSDSPLTPPKSVLIAFPFGFPSQLLVKELLQNDYVVTLYTKKDCCENHFQEVLYNLLAYTQYTDNDPVKMISSKDWSSHDVIVFPGLNTQADEDNHDFWVICKKLFVELKDVSVKPEAAIIFGQNTSGLVAAYHLGKSRPDIKHQIHVVSSIYEAVEKIFNDDAESSTKREAFSMPNGDIFLLNGTKDDTKRISHLRGSWNSGQFALLESTALYYATEAAASNEIHSTFHMTGRFMSEEEQTKNNAEAYTVVWYSKSIETSNDLAKKMKILSQWIRNECRDTSAE